MILIVAALACLACVPLTGGRLRRLLDLRVRCGWAAISALALQVIITTLAPSGSTGLHQLLHVASYALAGACLVVNRRIAGLPVLALGAALNTLAITTNAGIMPASARAMRLAGLASPDHFANSAPVAHPHLAALGDIIPIPGPWPLGNVISIGDILIMAGLLTILYHGSRVTPPTPLPDALVNPGRPKANPAANDG
jgi:hypothetical protein